LQGVVALIKPDLLREKIKEYYEILKIPTDYRSLAKISADMLQYIFSSPN